MRGAKNTGSAELECVATNCLTDSNKQACSRGNSNVSFSVSNKAKPLLESKYRYNGSNCGDISQIDNSKKTSSKPRLKVTGSHIDKRQVKRIINGWIEWHKWVESARERTWWRWIRPTIEVLRMREKYFG